MGQARVVKFEECSGYALYTQPENLIKGKFNPSRRSISSRPMTRQERELRELREGIGVLRELKFD